MQDSAGDGWDGASLDVLINGSNQGSFSVPLGGSSASEIITLCDGDDIELIFNSGTWDGEITYTLSSPSAVVFSDGPTPFVGSAFIGIGSCSGGGQTFCDAGPTNNIDSNLESFFLLGNTSQINYTGCPGVLGVENMTILSADVSPNGNYSASVQFGTCGSNFAGAGEAWVDWNQNSVYEASESIGSWQGTPPTASSNFNFIVPGGAIGGTTTMRVTHQEGGALPLDPCASFSWGSVVEFSIVVTGGIDCTGFDGDNSTSAIQVPSIPYVDTNSTVMCYSSQSVVYISPDVFYQFVVNPLAATTTVSLCGSSFDTYLTILDQNLNVITFNDDGASCSSGESEITFAPSTYDTLYAVVEGWNTESGEYIITITEGVNVGINSTLKVETKMYPNPATNIINFSGSQISHVKIIDVQGRMVLQTDSEHKITSIDISQLNSGPYVVKLKGANEVWNTKQLILVGNE